MTIDIRYTIPLEGPRKGLVSLENIMTDYTAEDIFERLKRVPLNMNNVNTSSFELEDVVRNDYPDFCDAFIGYAEFNDGTPVPEEQMDELNEECADMINELAHEHCF